MRLFSAQTGLNIVTSPEARKVNVSLYLRNVTPEAALDALCKSHDLWHKQDPASGVIRISTAKEYQRDLSSFREEQTEVFTLLYPNPVDVATAIRSIYGDRVILSLQSQEQDMYQDLTQRFNRFDLVDQRTQGFGLLSANNGTGGTGSTGGIGGGGGMAAGGMAARVASAERAAWRLRHGHGRLVGLGTLTGQFAPEPRPTALRKPRRFRSAKSSKGSAPRRSRPWKPRPPARAK